MRRHNYFITQILKHLEGELSAVEARELNDWVCQDSKNKELFIKVKKNWDEKLPDTITYDVKQAFERVSAQLGLSVEAVNRAEFLQVKKMKERPLRRWFAIAAALVGVLFLSKVVYNRFSGEVQYTTAVSQTATIVLPDHSIVTLYENSSISYSDDWGSTDLRKISLEGEAFFEVSENKSKPFLVTTSDLTIKVLGTSFNVRSYTQDEFIETTLVEGSVEVNNTAGTAKKLVLVPNQKAIYSRQTKHLILKDVDTGRFNLLEDEDFVFDNERVSDVIKVISKKFKANIKTTDGIGKCTVTADFSGQPFEVTLALLCRLIDAKYAINGHKVIIRGKGCEVQPMLN